jgi:hypothetical protein
MKKSTTATWLAEAIVTMLIIVTWVVWMYKIYTRSVQLETSVTNKIQAVQIAKEWIEAMINTRETNWILFASDYKNCWNTLNYNSLCMLNDTTTKDIAHNGKYKIYKDTDNRWKLHSPLWISQYSYMDSNYRANFKIWLDSNWFYTSTWTTTELKPLFTREIKIKYIDTDATGGANSNDEKMEITSLVMRMDKSSDQPHRIELKTILTNWKE